LNQDVLIVCDIDALSNLLFDTLLYPQGSAISEFNHRLWGGTGVHLTAGVNPVIAKITSSPAAKRLHIKGVLTLTETGKISYNGQYSDSILTSYSQAAFASSTITQSSISAMIINNSAAAFAFQPGSRATIYKLN
jgi:hypothetical protein